MNKKLSITISILVVLMGVIILFTLISKHNKDIDDIEEEKNNNFYLILDKYSVWEYDKKWKKSNKSRVDNNEYYVYVNNNAFGKYTLLYGTNWNLFDKNQNYIDYTGNLIAVSPNTNMSIIKYEKTNIDESDLSTIKQLINYPVYLEDISFYQKELADIDNNGTEDLIVIVSNNDIPNQRKYFNLAYVKLNGQVQVLIKHLIEPKDKLREPNYSMGSILLFDNKYYGNIILEKTYFSESKDPGNMMFEYDGKNYQLVIED